MKFPKKSSLFQHPFVDVFKQYPEMQMDIQMEGDVSELIDKQIRKKIFRIRGSVSASNYIQLPKDVPSSGQGLSLTGKYIYIQIKAPPSKMYTIHLDIVTSKKSSLRFSLSSMYTSMESNGTVLKIPLRLSGKWSVLALDIENLLKKHTSSNYDREEFSYLKGVKICSTLILRGIYTSDCLYDPKTLPSALELPVPKEINDDTEFINAWYSSYDWAWIPDVPNSQVNIRENLNTSLTIENINERDEDFIPINEDQRQDDILSQTLHLDKIYDSQVSLNTIQHEDTIPESRDIIMENMTNDFSVLSKADEVIEKAGITSFKENRSLYQSKEEIPKKTISSDIGWPDPILELDRLIGFSGQFSHCLLWTTDGNACVFASMSTLVVIDFVQNTVISPSNSNLRDHHINSSSYPIDVDLSNIQDAKVTDRNKSDQTLQQRFLFGHTQAICNLAFNSDSTLLASAQEGKNPVIRVWDFEEGKCVSIIKAHPGGVSHMDFSPDGHFFCAVGLDDHHRAQVIIWSITEILKGRPVVEAKQMCEFPISRIRFSPYEPNRLVSCGRENIRFWRIKKGHLPGCPVVLNEYARNSRFTDLAFDGLYGTHPSKIPHQRPLYVSSAIGTILVVDCDTMELQCVYKLHDGPINCISVNEGFCVTGSDDHFLRVWPLDFSDYFLEAQHEAEVTSLDVSSDGLRILIGTKNGAVGVLDVSSQDYRTVMRSHTRGIRAVSIDPSRPECATASVDGTIRIWNIRTGLQIYEFNIQQDCATCIAYHPTQHVIAVGFKSGCTRIFDIPSASVTEEYQQHRDELSAIEYSFNGTRLFTCGKDSQICVYDAQRGYQPIKILSSDFPSENSGFQVSPNGRYIAVIGPESTSILVLSTSTLKVTQKIEFNRKTMGKSGLNTHAVSFRLYRFCINSEEIVAIMENQRLIWFKVQTGEVARSTSFPGNAIDYMCISPNGRYMVTGDKDSFVKVWDNSNILQGSRCVQSYIGHCGNISHIGFTGDGNEIITTGDGNAINIWKFLGDTSLTTQFSLSLDGIRSPGILSPRDSNNLSPFSPQGFDDDDINPLMNIPRPLDRSFNDLQYGEIEAIKPSFSIPIKTLQTSDEREGSLVFNRMIGHNWNGKQTVVWDPIIGIIAYASCSSILVEDLQSGKQIVLEGHNDDINYIALSNRSTMMASADISNESIFLWHVTGECKVKLPLVYGTTTVSVIKFSFDDTYLIVGGLKQIDQLQSSSFVVIYEILTNKLILEKIHISTSPPSSIIMIPEQIILNMNQKNGQSKPQLAYMVTPFPIGNLEIHQMLNNKIQTTQLEFPSSRVHNIITNAFYSNDIGSKGSLILGSDSGDIWVYDLSNSTVLSHWNYRSKMKKTSELKFIHMLSTSSTEKYLILSTDLPGILRFDLPTRDDDVGGINWQKLSTGSIPPKLIPLSHTVNSMSWEKNPAEGIISTTDGSVWHLNLKTGQKTGFAYSHAKDIADMACFSDGSLIATAGGDDGSVRIWHPETLQQIVQFQASKTTSTCVALSNTGMRIGCASGYKDGSIRLFNLEKMELQYLAYPFGHDENGVSISTLFFASEYRALVCADVSGHIAIFDLSKVSPDKKITPSDIQIKSISTELVLHPDSKVKKFKVNPFSSDIILAIADSISMNQVMVYQLNNLGGKCPQLLDSWNIPKSNEMVVSDGVFSPTDETIIIYSHTDNEGISYLDFRSYPTREIKKRIKLSFLPKTIDSVYLEETPYLLHGTSDAFMLLDLEEEVFVEVSNPSFKLNHPYSKYYVFPKSIKMIQNSRLSMWDLNLRHIS